MKPIPTPWPSWQREGISQRQLVEFPIGEYDFSLIRHFLFDHAAQIRFDHWALSSYEPLARLARKVKGKSNTMYFIQYLGETIGRRQRESKARIKQL